jgi:selenocysteine lyase/cysteine desulfurase
VVFVGPYEHHSNELPWRESFADVVVIREDPSGGVDLDHLEEELRRHADRPMRVGSFAAASNVSGIVTDVDAVSTLLHRYGALACWDYASAGPYLPIDMNPPADANGGRLAWKDAVFVSPHKFAGGPGTPGVLIAKRSVFRNRVPTVPGGGTILFVSPTWQTYHPDPEIREEGGTPAIVESIRAGLVFALKEAVGAAEIRRREDDFARRAVASFSGNPNIHVLGNTEAERLAIVSFGLRHGSGMLHGNFVTAVLNDLFGIQARSGCFCAGPYVHRTFPIDDVWSERMDAEVSRGHMGAKLSFTRLGFNYFTSETVFDYVLRAVHLVAEEGWRLLSQYRFDPATGLWSHNAGPAARRSSLREVSFAGDGPIGGDGVTATESEDALPGYLDDARHVLEEAATREEPDDAAPLSQEFERIRWFPLPGEAPVGPGDRPGERRGRPSSILGRSWGHGAGRAGTWRSGRSA